MSDLLLIPVCITAGMLFSRLRIFPENSHNVLNTFIVYITLPALTLYYIPQLVLDITLIYPAIMIWIIFIASIPFFLLLQNKMKYDRKTTGALILTAGLANTSFVGFPVLIALFGEEGLKIGVVIDQAGSFLVLSTLGIIVASLYSKGTYSIAKIAKDVITYPSFIAFIISIIMIAFSIKHSDVSLSILDKLGSPTIILALISIGMQLKINVKEIIWRELTAGLIYKLFLAPALIYILFIYVFRQSGLSFEVSIMEAAMPPMVMGSVLANKFGLNPKLANLMVGIGIPVSAITLAFWFLIIKL